MVCKTYENVVSDRNHQLCSNIGLSENERVVVKMVIATVEKETSVDKSEREKVSERGRKRRSV